MAASDKPYYVSNIKLYEEYVNWYAAIKHAEENGLPEPKIPDYIVQSLYKICTKLSYNSKFIGYSYKEDMIGDAIINCIEKVKKFNPEKGKNPFAYLTTIAFNAYLRRIDYEKTQAYIKSCIIDSIPIDQMMALQEQDSDIECNIEFTRDNAEYMRNNTPQSIKRKHKKKQLALEASLFSGVERE